MTPVAEARAMTGIPSSNLIQSLSLRRRQAKKNAQAARTGAAAQGASAGLQPLSSASLTMSGGREGVRTHSADMEAYQRSRAIRPVGKLAASQAMPAAEAAALLAAVMTHPF